MADDTQFVKCPSCGHRNVPHADRCIICDAALPRYTNQPRTRPIRHARIVDDHHHRKQEREQVLECPACGYIYRAGSDKCLNCGAPLALQEDQQGLSHHEIDELYDDIVYDKPYDRDTQSMHDLDLDNQHPAEVPTVMVSQDVDKPGDRIPPGCMKFTSWMMLQLDVEGYETPLVVRPLEDKPLLIGRRHESLSVQPHIDLTPYLTERHGVSRRHALLRLRNTRLELQDLNSTNGTSINGIRFSPRESHQLRHQDIIRFGQIQIYVSYIQRARSAKFGHTEELM